jgi:RHS repeat-associated protein
MRLFESIFARIRTVLAALALASLALASQATTTDIYYHNDLAGTPMAATDGAGNVLWRQGYKPYGERLDPKAPAEQLPWYTGKAHVEAAGLSYYGARWYDPALGRFMGVDPVGFNEANLHSFNRYAYANNNPYKFVDLDGEQATSVLRPLLPPPVRVGVGAYEAATALGAGSLGSWLTMKALDRIYSESETSANDGGKGAGGREVGRDEGCIYCVKGENTRSGKDYVGSTDNMGQRERDSSDGRDRRGSEVVDTYPKGDRDARRTKEQKAINDRGGINELDNRRNEIAPRKWPDYGINPPK